MVGAAEGGHRQVGEIDLQDSEVGIRVASHDVRVGDPAVLELNADRVGVRNDVMVGHDVAGFIDNDPGAEAALDPAPVAGQKFAKQLAQRGRGPLPHQALGIDVHHRRCGAFNGRRISDSCGRRQGGRC